MAKICCYCLSKVQEGRQKTRPPPCFFRSSKTLFSGWPRNRTGTGNRNRRNRFRRNRTRNRNRRNRFPGTETGTGTVLTVKNCTETQKAPEPNRNRKPEPLEPFYPQTVTEPNRTGATLRFPKTPFSTSLEEDQGIPPECTTPSHSQSLANFVGNVSIRKDSPRRERIFHHFIRKTIRIR